MKGKYIILVFVLLLFIPEVVADNPDFSDAFTVPNFLDSYNNNPVSDIADGTDGAAIGLWAQGSAQTIGSRTKGETNNALWVKYFDSPSGQDLYGYISIIDDTKLGLFAYDEDSPGYINFIDELDLGENIWGIGVIPDEWTADNLSAETEFSLLALSSSTFCDSAQNVGHHVIIYNLTSNSLEKINSAYNLAGKGVCTNPQCVIDDESGVKGNTYCYYGADNDFMRYNPNTNTAAGHGDANIRGDCDADESGIRKTWLIPPVIIDSDNDGDQDIYFCCDLVTAFAVGFCHFEEDDFGAVVAEDTVEPIAGATNMGGWFVADVDGGNMDLVVSYERSEGLYYKVFDDTLTETDVNLVLSASAGYTAEISNPVFIEAYGASNEGAICSLYHQDETAGNDDTLGAQCYKVQNVIPSADSVVLKNEAGADNYMWAEGIPIVSVNVDIGLDSLNGYAINDLVTGSGYYELDFLAAGGSTDESVQFVASDYTTYDDYYPMITDADYDGVIDIWAVKENNMRIFLSSYTNSLPNLTALYGVDSVGSVCLNSFRTFTATECSSSSASTLDEKCNYVNDLSTDSLRLYSTCGNGTAQINGTANTGTLSLSCYFDTVGVRAFDVCIEDLDNIGETNQNTCISYTFNVINQTSAGVSCNFPCIGAQCFPGLPSTEVDGTSSTGFTTQQDFTQDTMTDAVSLMTGSNQFTRNLVSAAIIASVVFGAFQSGVNSIIVYTFGVSILSVILSLITLQSWTVTFTIIVLSMAFQFMAGLFSNGGDS